MPEDPQQNPQKHQTALGRSSTPTPSSVITSTAPTWHSDDMSTKFPEYELPVSQDKTLRENFPTVYHSRYKPNHQVKTDSASWVTQNGKERQSMTEENLMTRDDLEQHERFWLLHSANTVQNYAEIVNHDDYHMDVWLSQCAEFRHQGYKLFKVGDTAKDSWITGQLQTSKWRPTVLTDEEEKDLYSALEKDPERMMAAYMNLTK